MERPSLEELGGRKRKLDEELAKARREAKRVKLQVKDTKKRAEAFWKLSGFLLHASLIIYALAGYVAEPAVNFLRSSGRQRHWPDKSDEELEVMVENAFMQVDVEELARLADREDPSEPAAMKKAVSLVEQWRAAVWVRNLNSEQGVAPSTRSVLLRLEEQRESLPEGARPASIGTSEQAKARMWCRRFRVRWGGRHARIRLREDVSLTELREKEGTPGGTPLFGETQTHDVNLVPILGASLASFPVTKTRLMEVIFGSNFENQIGSNFGNQIGSNFRNQVCFALLFVQFSHVRPPLLTRPGTLNLEPFWFPKLEPFLVYFLLLLRRLRLGNGGTIAAVRCPPGRPS